jgi:molybdopterin biosynthesis enzyme
MGCLKRYIAREVFPQLATPQRQRTAVPGYAVKLSRCRLSVSGICQPE